MSQYHEIYNKAYEKITPEWLRDKSKAQAYLKANIHTLVDFYESYCSQFNFPRKNYNELKVLDLGCGLGGMSFYFASKGAQVTGIDVSNLAISAAKELARSQGLDIEFIQADLSEKPVKFGKFDLVFDSHLFHCLIEREHRKNYLELIKLNLTKTGLFLLETMVFHKLFRAPVGYFLDENFTLWKEERAEERAVRKILPGIELEQEIKDSGLSINYLYFHAELAFEIFEEYDNYPHQNLPQTARLAVRASGT